MEGFMLVVVIAVLIEAIVQVIKGVVPEGATVPGYLWPTCSIILGVMVCVFAKVDALAILGLEMEIPYVGCGLTGVLVSRGASFVHDVWGKVKGNGAVAE